NPSPARERGCETPRHAACGIASNGNSAAPSAARRSRTRRRRTGSYRGWGAWRFPLLLAKAFNLGDEEGVCHVLTQLVIAGLDPAIHAADKSAWTTGSSPVGAKIAMFPGRSAARSAAEWCAADPGSSQAPSLRRSRISSASLRAALHPGNAAYLSAKGVKSCGDEK